MRLQIAVLMIGTGINVFPYPASACHCSQSGDTGIMSMPAGRFQAVPGYMNGARSYAPGQRARYRRMRYRMLQARGYALPGPQWGPPPRNRYVQEYHWPDSAVVQAPPTNPQTAPESLATAGSIPFIPFDAPISGAQQPVAVRQVRGQILNSAGQRSANGN